MSHKLVCDKCHREEVSSAIPERVWLGLGFGIGAPEAKIYVNLCTECIKWVNEIFLNKTSEWSKLFKKRWEIAL